MRVLTQIITLLIVLASSGARAGTAAQIENCGWLIKSDATLTEQPEPKLKLRGDVSIPTPPADTAAAICDREGLVLGKDEWRLILIGFPLVVRSGDRMLVYECPPGVVFGYHWAANRFEIGPPSSPSN